MQSRPALLRGCQQWVRVYVVRMVYVVGHIQPAPDALNWVGDVHMTLSVFGMS